MTRIPNAALRYKPTPPTGPDGKPVPQPPEAPLEKGKGRVWVLTSDKPGGEKDEMRHRLDRHHRRHVHRR